ncbi:SAM-dependent DNA methyltransferase [Pseudoflavitalea sp. G-6-1-2]|uniref:type I restriction-modification system subunit M n=1 Tax=Pseudoflavitalea sp. G-6-1-2 TaxID=2728841 RepID=UPI00146DFAF4|nr:class I SAM-dependent DNA methyltransferase [Pseudoflavitalea sp. G-6-1-2]NML23519.1 SAM-dependent DNA methyltransferase [Pseudoflavitalea sp. G-6-1-2]
MNHIQHNQIVNFIWGIADDVLRDVYTRGKYRDIILPFTVLRRLDALLEPSKDKVIEMHEQLNKLKIENQSPQLRKVSGYVFYNTSKYTFKKLLNDPANIRQNLENYLDGFSSDVQDIISKFKLRNQLDTLEEGNITFPLIEKFCSSQINLSPVAVKDKDGNIVHEGLSNLGMGYVFEELIRKFNEENNEEAGEHFTPREIIKLMTHLIFEPVKNKIKEGTYLIYDPACGSGGMLTEAEHFALEINPKATYHLYGQEVNPETFAICKADMLIKEEDPEKIAFGSTLSNDGFPKLKFDFMLSNPPYGKTWKVDQDSIVDSKTKEILDSRFSVGVPRVSDGQLLFLMNMVSKMKVDSEIGSRIASVHNGSSLFTGEAGGGESEIRKYIIENDLLEAIIQLPNDMFYNTGIATYIWVLSNKKEERRKGKVQLIDASSIYSKMRKGLGSKSNELTETHIQQIADAFKDFQQNEISRNFENDDFAYWSITVERPLRLAWQLTEEKLSAIEDTDYYLPVLKALQKQFGTAVQNDFNQLLSALDTQLKKLSLKWKPKEKKTFLDALSWRDEEAQPVIKKQDKDEVIYEADPELRDYESVPVKQNVQEYFEKEVWPFVPDAWIDHSKTVKGYEVSFTKIFYRYQPLRSVATITEEIMQLERETEGLLNDIIA